VSLAKHAGLFGLASSNLVRYSHKTIALFFPLCLAMTLASAMTFVKDGLKKDALLSTSSLPDITLQRLLGGRLERLNEESLSKVGTLPGIARLIPRVWGYFPLELGGKPFVYTLIGIHPGLQNPKMMGLCVASGRFLKPGDDNEAVIGSALARALGVHVGESIVLKDALGNAYAFRVVGLFAASVQIYATDMLVTTIGAARAFLGYGNGEASDSLVYLEEGASADLAAKSIASLDPRFRVLTRDTLTDATKQAYSSRAGIFSLVWLVLLLTAALVAWAQLSSISLEQRKEVGILRSVGWGVGDIIELKLFESLIVGVMATLSGLFLGAGYLLLGAPLIKGYFIGWSSVFPEFPLPAYAAPESVALLFFTGVFPLIFASVVPSWAASSLEVDRCLRG
jgi:ABC-type lipoprotein release transport system permease subunit